MYRHYITFVFALFLTPAIVFGDEPATEMPTAAQLEFFETKIRPVLVQHCYKCHSEDSDSVKGGLLLDSRKAIQVGGDSGPGVVPGEPDESVVLSAMRYESFEMPPKGKLSDEVLQDFATWIKQGAADPREGGRLVSKTVIDFEAAGNFWAFQKPVKSKLPNVQNKAWMANPIDRYVAADLAKKNL